MHVGMIFCKYRFDANYKRWDVGIITITTIIFIINSIIIIMMLRCAANGELWDVGLDSDPTLLWCLESGGSPLGHAGD